MSDAFGPLLRQLQAEMRSLKADLRALREEVASRAYVDARAGETENLMQDLFDLLNQRLDQTERSVEERDLAKELDGEPPAEGGSR